MCLLPHMIAPLISVYNRPALETANPIFLGCKSDQLMQCLICWAVSFMRCFFTVNTGFIVAFKTFSLITIRFFSLNKPSTRGTKTINSILRGVFYFCIRELFWFIWCKVFWNQRKWYRLFTTLWRIQIFLCYWEKKKTPQTFFAENMTFRTANGYICALLQNISAYNTLMSTKI